MDFDTENKVIIETMKHAEAVAFIKFMHSEILRHERDIDEAYQTIITVGSMFNINVFDD